MLVERGIAALERIGRRPLPSRKLPACPCACQALHWRQIENEREVRPCRDHYEPLQSVERCGGQAPGCTLVDPSGIGKAVADNPAASCQRRPDRLVEMVGARGEEEE